MKLLEYLRKPSLAVRKLQWLRLYRGRPREVTVDTFNGRLTFHSRDRFIGKQLFVNRGFEEALTVATMTLLRDEGLLRRSDGVLVEAGANIGMTSIALLRHGHFARAVVFEPAPQNVRLLEHNIGQNGFATRIRVIPVAVSSRDGTMPFELSETNYGDHRIRLGASQGAFAEDRRGVIAVPVRTLDGALAEAGVRPDDVTLLWVDVQGHDGHLFLGARELLARRIPVVTEFWPYGIRRAGMTPEEYLGIVTPLFTHYYVLRAGSSERRGITRLGDEFARLTRASAMEQILLVTGESRGVQRGSTF